MNKYANQRGRVQALFPRRDGGAGTQSHPPRGRRACRDCARRTARPSASPAPSPAHERVESKPYLPEYLRLSHQGEQNQVSVYLFLCK